MYKQITLAVLAVATLAACGAPDPEFTAKLEARRELEAVCGKNVVACNREAVNGFKIASVKIQKRDDNELSRNAWYFDGTSSMRVGVREEICKTGAKSGTAYVQHIYGFSEGAAEKINLDSRDSRVKYVRMACKVEVK